MNKKLRWKWGSLVAITILIMQIFHSGLILAEVNENENPDQSNDTNEEVSQEEIIQDEDPPEFKEKEEVPSEVEDEHGSPEDLETEKPVEEEESKEEEETEEEESSEEVHKGNKDNISKSKENDKVDSSKEMEKKNSEKITKPKATDRKETSTKKNVKKEITSPKVQKQKVSIPSSIEEPPIQKVLGLQKEIFGIITEANLENHVISSINQSTFLDVYLTEKVRINGIVWDALNPYSGVLMNGDLGAVIDDELNYWDSYTYGPGEEQLYISKKYCPYGRAQELCAEDLPEGVYSIKLSAVLEDRFIDGELEVGPLFIKESSASIELGSMDENIMKGKVSDSFIDWAPTVKEVYGEEYDVNDYLIASYTLEDEYQHVLEEDSFTLNQDGTFSIPLENLAEGQYTVLLKIEDVGENSPTEKRITLRVENGEVKVSNDTSEQTSLDDLEELEIMEVE